MARAGRRIWICTGGIAWCITCISCSPAPLAGAGPRARAASEGRAVAPSPGQTAPPLRRTPRPRHRARGQKGARRIRILHRARARHKCPRVHRHSPGRPATRPAGPRLRTGLARVERPLRAGDGRTRRRDFARRRGAGYGRGCGAASLRALVSGAVRVLLAVLTCRHLQHLHTYNMASSQPASSIATCCQQSAGIVLLQQSHLRPLESASFRHDFAQCSVVLRPRMRAIVVLQSQQLRIQARIQLVRNSQQSMTVQVAVSPFLASDSYSSHRMQQESTSLSHKWQLQSIGRICSMALPLIEPFTANAGLKQRDRHHPALHMLTTCTTLRMAQ